MAHQIACTMMNADADMPSLQIRDLPEDVYEALAYRADRERRSLAQQAVVELRRALEQSRGTRRREVVEELQREAEGGSRREGLPAPEEPVWCRPGRSMASR